MINLFKKIVKLDFVKKSSLIFIANNVANLFNYVTVILVVALLGNEFGLWVSTSGLLAVLSVPISSLMAILVSKFSRLSEDNPVHAYSFYLNFLKILNKYKIYLFILAILAIIITNYSLRFQNLSIPVLLVFSVFVSLFTNINQNFLLGILEIKKYSFGILAGAISKIIFTFGLIGLGAGILALPLGLILSSLLTLFIAIYNINKIFKSSSLSQDILDLNFDFDLLADGKNTLKASAYFIILSLFLNIDVIFSRSLLPQNLNNQYALISTFGQIAHFGPISLAALVVPYASRDSHRKVFQISSLAIFGFGLLISAAFYFFGGNILSSFKKSADLDTIWLIFVYSIFIIAYNLIFVNLNYLISRLNFKAITPMIAAILVFSGTLFYIATSSSFAESSKIYTMIYSSLAITATTAAMLLIYIWNWSKSK